ncbi:putative GAG-pre-integrase domain-containing protein [Helianthus annuus]|nr:putative GAG-pre-integrase domain-containing protein [Helianthus annuus]
MPDGENTTTTQPSSEKQPLHPAYTVTNINNKIRTLDGKKVTYSAWVKLFTLHARAYKVLHHIDDTKPPDESDPNFPAWSELDALILQWIYSTLSDDLLSRVLDTNVTARTAWLNIQEIFLNNKQARAATLETKFTGTTLQSCSSFDEYCQTLKELAEQLKDVDQPVSESRLVIQMVRGLPIEFDTIAAIINREKPKWEVARSMIEDEQSRQAARSNTTRDTVLLHPTPNNSPLPPNDSTRSPYPNGYRGRNYDPAKAARGRGYNSRGGRGGRAPSSTGGRGPASWSTNYPTQQNPHPQPNQAHNHPLSQPTWNTTNGPPSWSPPPTPYPSYPAHYTPPPYPQQQSQVAPQQAHIAQQPPPAPPGFEPPQGNALCPSDIGVALSSLSLNYHDPQWNMDSGASSHITSDPGTILTPSLLPQHPILDLKDGRLLSRHNSSGDLYPFTKPEFNLLSTTTHPPWHDRLGHPGAAVLQHIFRTFNISCNKNIDLSFCSSCQLSNSKRLPFVKKKKKNKKKKKTCLKI